MQKFFIKNYYLDITKVSETLNSRKKRIDVDDIEYVNLDAI